MSNEFVQVVRIGVDDEKICLEVKLHLQTSAFFWRNAKSCSILFNTPLAPLSLWGGCCQLLFRGGYRPGFETWLRIRYFDGYSILRLRDGSSSDLRGSKKLAKAL